MLKNEFEVEERIAGSKWKCPCQENSIREDFKNHSPRIADRLRVRLVENGIKDEHSDGEIVPESLFEDGELENNHVDDIFSKKEKEVSEDPFNLYSLLKRQNKLDDKDTNSEDSLKHPPGFTPLTHNCENDTSEKKVDQNDEFSEAGDVDKLKGSANGSISAGHFKVSEIPRTGGSMVGLLEDVIKVGQVMGFKMEGVIANLEELIGTQGGKEGYR
ncbi:hypothetical protein Tco_0923730 [Tanacetum coccineum]|uniref:Uncharacterized protein n=1 Tax=Tanacetum coccineum TaxID=301880 RepID=A0ABQ5D1X8_9ASTR